MRTIKGARLPFCTALSLLAYFLRSQAVRVEIYSENSFHGYLNLAIGAGPYIRVLGLRDKANKF
eukprot:scaffold5479_cov199-Amphora_coffeaeformis.AAC.45